MIVYHYCSVESFYEIITNKSIRLSDITKSNDSMEILWFTQYIKEIFKEEYQNEKSKYFASEEPFENLIDFCQKLFLEDSSYTYFVFCFSEINDLLSQWRGYADDGKGIAIGFENSLIDNISQPKNSNSILQFNKVAYEENQQKKIIREAAQDLIKKLKISLSKFNPYAYDPSENKFMPFFTECFSQLFNHSIFIKNPFFREEQEWRLCYKSDLKSPSFKYLNDKSINLNDDFYLSKLNFQNRKNKLVPYLDLNFSKCKKPFIKEIIIGPKSQVTGSDIQQFLSYNNIQIEKINISRSKSTYR